MSKLLMLGLIAASIYFFFIRKPSKNRATKNHEDTKINAQTMIECSECDIYIALDDSIVKDGKNYCSKECAKLS